jgi:hypothetical protein
VHAKRVARIRTTARDVLVEPQLLAQRSACADLAGLSALGHGDLSRDREERRTLAVVEHRECIDADVEFATGGRPTSSVPPRDILREIAARDEHRSAPSS